MTVYFFFSFFTYLNDGICFFFFFFLLFIFLFLFLFPFSPKDNDGYWLRGDCRLFIKFMALES